MFYHVQPAKTSGKYMTTASCSKWKMKLALETYNLTKYYGKVKILDNLNLAIPIGRFHGLIGPNGAGKTTTLKILCGISKQTSGSARIRGFDIHKHSNEVKKIIGYIPENPTLYKSLTVAELLQFVGKIYMVPREIRESRTQKYLSMFQIEYAEKKFIGSLSKGELQRILICSLMIREPSVFLLDEPFHALDPEGAVIFRQLLKEKCKKGATVLLATHLLDIAEKLCESFTFLNKGLTIANGDMQDFKKLLGNDLSLEQIFLYYIRNQGNQN